jgi:hypothetical protein
LNYNNEELNNGFATNMFPQQQLNYNNEEWCFLCCPCKGVINGTGLEFGQLWDI